MLTDAAKNTASQIINFAINGSNQYLSTIFHHRVDAATTGLPVDKSPAAPINSAYLTSAIKHFFGNQHARRALG